MRQAFLLLGFWCALASSTLAQYDKPEQPAAASQAAKPDFSMTASYIEACSCDMFCPCYFNNHSTMHGDKQFCRANLVLKVDTGYYKSIKLDGAKVWVSTDLGSNWSTGKDSWVVMTFDPSDTPEQKAALSDILGQLYPFKWEKAATDTAAFSWSVDEKTGEAHAKMNNGKGEVAPGARRWDESATGNCASQSEILAGSIKQRFPHVENEGGELFRTGS